MPHAARLDLKMNADEKAVIAKAAALVGMSMAGFVRAAAKEKARQLLEHESRITLSAQQFADFACALDDACALHPALRGAVSLARDTVRRA